MGEMAEVAAAGTFLCSQDAKFITGKSYIKPFQNMDKFHKNQLYSLNLAPLLMCSK